MDNTGMPVLRNHPEFWLFLFANSFSFLFSAVGMFIHYFKISKQKKKTTPTSEKLLDFFTYFSISLMLCAYFASMSEFMFGYENQSVSIAPPPK